MQGAMSDLKDWIFHVLPAFNLSLAELKDLVLLYCVHYLCFNDWKREDFASSFLLLCLMGQITHLFPSATVGQFNLK